MLKKGAVLKTTFDEYAIIEQIGQGGNGTVYKVQDNSGKQCAIKLISRTKNSKDKVSRFRNEIDFCRKNNHPNIVHVLDHGTHNAQDDEYIFYVMPLYHCTLRKMMEKPLDPEKIMFIFAEILHGLEYAHKQNIWHRDIKPENVLVSNDLRQIVIADFGIAHFSSETLLTTVETKHTDRLANFLYAAPEQRVKGSQVDGRADIFALGLILNEMFTGMVIGGANYRRIRDVSPQNAYLDDVADSLICQNPVDRLYPSEKILLEIAARTRDDKERTDIIAWQASIGAQSSSAFVPISVPKVINIDYERGHAVFHLDYLPPRRWMDILKSGNYSHSAIWGHEPDTIIVNESTLEMPFERTNRDPVVLSSFVGNFKDWLVVATQIYNRTMDSEEKRKIAQEKQRIEREIEGKKREQELRESLKTLL